MKIKMAYFDILRPPLILTNAFQQAEFVLKVNIRTIGANSPTSVGTARIVRLR